MARAASPRGRSRSKSKSKSKIKSKNGSSPRASPRNRKGKPSSAKTLTSDAKQSDVYMFYTLAVIGVVVCIVFFTTAPELPDDPSCDVVRSLMPNLWTDKVKTIEQSYTCMKKYKETHEAYLITGYILVYVVAQAFAIPGPPLLLTILAGAFYSPPLALLLAGGSAVCFCLSYLYGKGVLALLVKADVMEEYKKRLENVATKWDMVKFMLLSRVTPVPNVLVNLASPLLGVPLWIFAPTTFIGQIPLNSVHVTTGFTLSQANKYQADTKKSTIIAGVGTLITVLVAYNFYSKNKKDGAKDSKKKK